MPAYMPARKRQDIREALQAGMTSAEIRQLWQASAGSIINIKRELGMPIRPMMQTRTKGPIKAVARVAAEVVPPAPTAPPAPAEYVAAFEARVWEFHRLLKEQAAEHEQELRVKQAEIDRLETQHSKLIAEYAQIVHQQAAWTGPTSTITQSLGNGG